MFKEIKTKRFVIRELTYKDKDSFEKYVNDKEISKNNIDIPYPYPRSKIDLLFDEIISNYSLEKPKHLAYGIYIDTKVCGYIGLHKIHRHHKAEIGYWLAKKYRNQGIMTLAIKKICEHGFKKLKLKRIWAPVFSYNSESKKVLEKNGFILEGILKKSVFKDKSFVDEWIYSKTK
jgi:[ribosomal protein S5]-alanine N-acetyltransferase